MPRRRRDPLWLPRGAATTAASAVNKRGATVRTNALAAAQVAAAAEPWLEPLGLLAECVERLRPGLERAAGAGAASVQ